MTQAAAFATTGNMGDAIGNTIQCRLYHAGVALAGGSSAQAIHCTHTSVVGGGALYCGSASNMTSTGSMTSTGGNTGINGAYARMSFSVGLISLLLAAIVAALLA